MVDPSNSTFIDLIPKIDILVSFDHFQPISLCNSIYNVIAIIIELYLKDNISSDISFEQFGFHSDR